MSWSVSATGKNATDTIENLREGLGETPQCPADVAGAAIEAAYALVGGLTDTQVVISTACSGHFDDQGAGYVTLTVATA